MKNRQAALKRLDQLGIPYRLIEHPPVHTIEDCGRVEGIDPRTTEFVRNAFLAPASTMRQRLFSSHAGEDGGDVTALRRQYLQAHPDLRFTLMLLRHDIPFRTAIVSRALGISRLSFAPDDLLPLLLGLSAGAVSPLGLPFDRDGRVTLLIDTGLADYAFLAFHPCDNTASAILSTDDFLSRYLPGIGVTPVWVDPLADEIPAQ